MGEHRSSIKQLQEQCGAGCGQRFARAARETTRQAHSSVLQALAAPAGATFDCRGETLSLSARGSGYACYAMTTERPRSVAAWAATSAGRAETKSLGRGMEQARNIDSGVDRGG